LLLKENMLPMPKSPYGLQKYVGEHYARLFSLFYGMETVSLRYFNVYGPRMAEEGAYCLVIVVFLKQQREGKPLTICGDGTQTRDFTHVCDVAVANILAMNSPKVGHGEVMNIGAGDNHSVKEIADLIGGEVQYLPPRVEPYDTLADNTLARELLDWEPKVKFEEAITELVKNNM
jgi:UDP-glucose 4-epimerase